MDENGPYGHQGVPLSFSKNRKKKDKPQRSNNDSNHHHSSPPSFLPTVKHSPPPQPPTTSSIHSLATHLLSISLARTLATSSLNSVAPPLLPTIPFAQSKKLLTGLEYGKIRHRPSINPGSVSTNPQSSSFAFPWTIPENNVENAVQKLKEAIFSSQKNAAIKIVEDIPSGKYLLAEVDGGFRSKDVLEFLVKGDVASYRAMATKVTYFIPIHNSLRRLKGTGRESPAILDLLGWDAPRFDAMDSDEQEL